MLILILATLPNWMSLIERQPMVYTNVPFPVESPAHADQALKITVERCNFSGRDLTYTFTRTVKNTQTGETWALPLGGADIEPGCLTVQSRVNVLPDDLPPGRYVLSAVSQVPGQYRVFTVPWRTQEFEVVP